MRMKSAWKDAIAKERLLILSPFENRYNRQTETLANRRNAFVAALADKIYIAHAAEGSKTLKFAEYLITQGKPVFTFETPANEALIQLGAQQMEPSVYVQKNTNATTPIVQFGGT